jgi:PDZ domain-containing protein
MASPAIQAEAVVSSVIDTQPETVPTRPPAVRAPAPVHRAWAVPMVVIAFAAIATMLVASMLSAELVAENAKGDDAPYALVPADATEVASRISFDAVQRHSADGEILFVTVREPAVTLLDWFISRAETEVVPHSTEDKFGVQTEEQKKQVNLVMMRTAKENAEYVALKKLGYPAEIVLGEVIIGQLLCFEASEDGSTCVDSVPADELLDPGDRLLEVDGTPITIIDDLGPILEDHERR